MSKAPWTPGPWRACKDGACVCGHIWAEGDKRVATVHGNTRDSDGTVYAEWSREERVANARLIAAAPRLAEALQQLLDYTLTCELIAYGAEEQHNEHPVVAAARAALREAGAS